MRSWSFLSTDTPLETSDGIGFVYLLRDVKYVNHWKIGYTTQEDPEKRVKQLQRQNGQQYEIEKSWKVINCRNMERMIHILLPSLGVAKPPKKTNGSGKPINGKTEWFHAPEKDIIDRVDSLMEEAEQRRWTIIYSVGP